VKLLVQAGTGLDIFFVSPIFWPHPSPDELLIHFRNSKTWLRDTVCAWLYAPEMKPVSSEDQLMLGRYHIASLPRSHFPEMETYVHTN